MSGETDGDACETASKQAGASSDEFDEIDKMAASVDTLDGFLREMKTRFPDATARAPLPPETQKADPFPTGSLPQIVGLKRVDAARELVSSASHSSRHCTPRPRAYDTLTPHHPP